MVIKTPNGTIIANNPNFSQCFCFCLLKLANLNQLWWQSAQKHATLKTVPKRFFGKGKKEEWIVY